MAEAYSETGKSTATHAVIVVGMQRILQIPAALHTRGHLANSLAGIC